MANGWFASNRLSQIDRLVAARSPDGAGQILSLVTDQLHQRRYASAPFSYRSPQPDCQLAAPLQSFIYNDSNARFRPIDLRRQPQRLLPPPPRTAPTTSPPRQNLRHLVRPQPMRIRHALTQQRAEIHAERVGHVVAAAGDEVVAHGPGLSGHQFQRHQFVVDRVMAGALDRHRSVAMATNAKPPTLPRHPQRTLPPPVIKHLGQRCRHDPCIHRVRAAGQHDRDAGAERNAGG